MRSTKARIQQLLVTIFFLILSSLIYAETDLKENLTTKAKAGDVEAQFELGNRLLKGWGMAFFPKEAVRWLKQAADKDHVDDQILRKSSSEFCNLINISNLAVD